MRRSAFPRWGVLSLTERKIYPGPQPNAQEKRSKKELIPRLLRYILPHWYLFAAAICTTLLSNQLALMGPHYSGIAIDAITAEGGVQFDLIWPNVIRMLLCYVFSALLSYLLSQLMVRLSQRIVYSMRRQLFEKLTVLPVNYFDRNATGDIISRISYDIDTINTSLSHHTVHLMTMLYSVIGALVYMLNIFPPVLLVFAVTVPASFLFGRFRSNRVRPLFRRRSHMLGQLNGYAEELLSGCRTIQLYGQETEIDRRFGERNDETSDAYYDAEYYGAAIFPGMNFITNVSIACVTVLGGIFYMYSQNGTFLEGSVFFLSLGGMAQLVQYSRRFANPISEFANIMHEFQSAFSAAERVFRLLDEAPEAPDEEDARVLTEVRGEVALDKVDFGYTPDKQILYDICLDVKPGMTVAIVGPTGSGKTTLINLLMRFYDVDGGAILLEGSEIGHITRDSLRQSYTMLLQDTWLFHGTVFENIAYGREDATREEVIAAAKAARIHSYIDSLPDGYDTMLSDEGVNISKGQRQLITIARAMLSRSPLLILDEATSNVDSRTEQQIQQAMNALMVGRTCFVIAHRLSTVRYADRILVMQNGHITERGTHDELLALGGFYATLYNSQFT